MAKSGLPFFSLGCKGGIVMALLGFSVPPRFGDESVVLSLLGNSRLFLTAEGNSGGENHTERGQDGGYWLRPPEFARSHLLDDGLNLRL